MGIETVKREDCETALNVRLYEDREVEAINVLIEIY